MQVRTADLRDPASLVGLLEGSAAVCCATGTTAFPSKRCNLGAETRRKRRYLLIVYRVLLGSCWVSDLQGVTLRFNGVQR